MPPNRPLPPHAAWASGPAVLLLLLLAAVCLAEFKREAKGFSSITRAFT
jgi:hypothetical protein